MIVMAPSNENELRALLSTAYLHPGPAAVRYPRGAGIGIAIDPRLEPLPVGRARVVRDGSDVALLVFGTLLATAHGVAAQLNATLADMRFVKPLDEELIIELARRHKLLVTVEENVIAGGAGTAVGEFLAAALIGVSFGRFLESHAV